MKIKLCCLQMPFYTIGHTLSNERHTNMQLVLCASSTTAQMKEE